MYFPLEALKIYKSFVYSKVRLGKKRDGGYVILDGLKYDLLLCCGMGRDISFEHALLTQQPKLHCWAYDGTLKKFKQKHKRLVYNKQNISTKNTKDTVNLHNVLDEHKNIFLKIELV